jgi:hypothetical protein
MSLFGLFIYSSGFTMMESTADIAINVKKSPPNIERGILKIGCPWRT